ncbi:phospholipase [Mycolicibacterium duvalii]|uniref:Phospholipase n=1 Tax=Mycolicibacterium duvalii TaxID=39688 RepID=A0A7I7KAG4_9MYCO|nr:patatin-like phospholipase family protein [Mycolicibacterium duvalii]BBX20579.1 phospholipase [Mycolicibacterium duvalii]
MTDGMRALVLAGGGLAGIAWETGVLLGICDEARGRLLDSEVLVGTSAGSTVAAQLSSGTALEELFARQLSDEAGARKSTRRRDRDDHRVFLDAMQTRARPKKLRKIGAVAAAADTVSEPTRRDVIAHRLPSHDWPRRVLRMTGIDLDTGELVIFDNDSGVGLVDAVAASCAVPGVWPPVRIGSRRFMDGGVGSTVNMSAADDCATAVALVPSSSQTPSPWGTGTVDEINAFPGATLAIYADAESLQAFGPNPLDPACRAPSAQAGRPAGSARVAEFLGA